MHLGNILGNKYKLSKINLNNNLIGDEGLKHVAQGLMENDTLRVITLQSIGISHVSIPPLSSSLKNKKFLTKLLLDGNVIGVDGAKALAAGIRDNETLTNLHLSECMILEDGAKEIALSLENKRNLLVLDLTSNKIMSDGCIAICKAIQSQSTLRELHLS